MYLHLLSREGEASYKLNMFLLKEVVTRKNAWFMSYIKQFQEELKKIFPPENKTSTSAYRLLSVCYFYFNKVNLRRLMKYRFVYMRFLDYS